MRTLFSVRTQGYTEKPRIKHLLLIITPVIALNARMRAVFHQGLNIEEYAWERQHKIR